MNQPSSVREDPQSVPQVLTSDKHPTALIARLPPACAGGRHLANGTEQLSAACTTRHRHATDDALTSNLGHQMGAGDNGFVFGGFNVCILIKRVPEWETDASVPEG